MSDILTVSNALKELDYIKAQLLVVANGNEGLPIVDLSWDERYAISEALNDLREEVRA